MINAEKDKLDFESLPEFVREPYSATRETLFPTMSFRSAPVKEEQPEPPAAELAKTAELEALWPGVSHDYFQPTRRKPGASFTAGFVSGILVTLVGVWGVSTISHLFTSNNNVSAGHKIVVAGGSARPAKIDKSQGAAVSSQVINGQEVITPQFSTYEVKTGDTLAGIAIKAYHRATPRLLDEICRANGMRNANVLTLGQKLLLPEYRPQTSQVAGASQNL